MKLRNADQARVQRQKITEYLLSPTNPSGRTKAAFFPRFGFGIEQWEALAEALYSHCLQNQVLETRETAYGMQYVIVGPISTPDGRNPTIRTVWQVDNGADHPRFITARPAR